MEYLEGQTLAQRLEKGALPLDEALKVAVEITDAMDKAHRQGVVHRDLKPSNVMLTKSGAKLLDFGLAKLKQSGQPDTLSALPTRADVTAQGTIFGTLQYMSPEQLEGPDADARTDVFAFGAVLYEMASGKKAFEGKSQASLIGAIMTSEPAPLSKLQPVAPPGLDHIVRTCLAKDPEARWQSAADLCAELRWIAAAPSVVESIQAGGKRISIREIAAWSVAAVALITVLLMLRGVSTPAPSASVTRFSVLPPTKGEFDFVDGPGTLSPDGRYIVFKAPDPAGEDYLWLRALDSVDSKMLSSHGGYDPFWSPDSRQLAFGNQNELYKIDVAAGAVDKICDLPDGRGGTWNKDGVILFTRDAHGPLFRVSSSGGTPAPVTRLEASRQETGHWRPQFLPDGKHFIYLALSTKRENTGIYAGSLDSPEVKRVADLDMAAYYTPPGYLFYVRQGNLTAQPFDAGKLLVTGEPVVVARGIPYSAPWGAAGFSTSDTGVLAYQANIRPTQLLFWFDRSGKQIGAVGEHNTYRGGVRISPDGRRAAVEQADRESRSTSIWVSDFGRGVASRFTQDVTAVEDDPVWSPDSNRIAFVTTRGGPNNFYVRSASGVGEDELLLRLPAWGNVPEDWSPDGKVLLYSGYDAKTKRDLWMLPMSGDHTPKPFLQTRFSEYHGRFSPDGRWVAYVSDESGKPEVWAQSFLTPGKKRQISDKGGIKPEWRGDGHEIFYLDPNGKLMSAEIRTGSTIESSAPKPLFSILGAIGFAPTSDGQRFLVTMSDPAVDPWPITVVLNWPAAFKK
jgi:Tol biopolymer transport system component